MKIILIAGSIILPLAMFYSQKRWILLKVIYNYLAAISFLVFGNIASLSIYEIIKDNTVFMTSIHAIFLNPFFLLTGSYIGIYVLYRLLLLNSVEQHRQSN